jgi:hypothetical protein
MHRVAFPHMHCPLLQQQHNLQLHSYFPWLVLMIPARARANQSLSLPAFCLWRLLPFPLSQEERDAVARHRAWRKLELDWQELYCHLLRQYASGVRPKGKGKKKAVAPPAPAPQPPAKRARRGVMAGAAAAAAASPAVAAAAGSDAAEEATEDAEKAAVMAQVNACCRSLVCCGTLVPLCYAVLCSAVLRMPGLTSIATWLLCLLPCLPACLPACLCSWRSSSRSWRR